MNTPDTEGKNPLDFLDFVDPDGFNTANKTLKNGIVGRYQEQDTPDTEREKEYNMPSIEVHDENWIRLSDHINLLASRDTYWKERVAEERMRARQEVQIKQQIGQLGYEVIVATLVNTPVDSERIKSKMAQALKEAIADNLIR